MDQKIIDLMNTLRETLGNPQNCSVSVSQDERGGLTYSVNTSDNEGNYNQFGKRVAPKA